MPTNADMWATAAESRADLVALYRRVWSHSDATIAALPLDVTGLVPWWSLENREPTLHRVLTHVIAEVHRHAGHADLVRELIDGSVGLRPSAPNLPRHDEAWWDDYRDRLERLAPGRLTCASGSRCCPSWPGRSTASAGGRWRRTATTTPGRSTTSPGARSPTPPGSRPCRP